VELFSVPGGDDLHPRYYWDRCLKYPEHMHLADGEPDVAFLMRNFDKVEAGRQVLGSVHLPGVQGKLKDVFEWMLASLLGGVPDFLVILDAGYWESVDDRRREILMFHEMAHCVQAEDQFGTPKFTREGIPVWKLRGHSVEEFTEVVRRYGAWNDELVEFLEAAKGAV